VFLQALSTNLDFGKMETKCESDPLFLTPMLRAGKIDEARKLAKVDGLPGIPGLDSFSGFMTVNKTDNSNMFFWFFPATVKKLSGIFFPENFLK